MSSYKPSLPLIGVVVFLCHLAAAVQLPAQSSQRSQSPAKPLSFFEPFIGPWLPDPAWPALEGNPELRKLVPLNFEWGPKFESLYFEEGLPLADRYAASGLVVWNPTSERAEFLAFQAEDLLVFSGYYEPLGAGAMRRVYDVIHRDGTVVHWRETFELAAPDKLDWTTERLRSGEWVANRPGGPEFRAVRASATEVGHPLSGLERLIGKWRPDPSTMPKPMADWRRQNGITDGYVSFEWGTRQRWIEFGEHRKQDERWRVEGFGLIAWNPGAREISYREHSDSGVTLEGSVVLIDDSTFERHYRAFQPDGSALRWLDTWRFSSEDDDCFEWTTRRVETAPGTPPQRPGYRVCRMPSDHRSLETRPPGQQPRVGGVQP